MEIFESFLVAKYISHRGLHNEAYPENSLGAFKNSVDHNFAIELDVHLLDDGTIVVFHDDTLSRICGVSGYLRNQTKETIKNCKLLKTDFSIPTFNEVLEIVNGKVPLLIEIKNENTKIGVLESKLYEMLKKYQGQYAIQSFNPYSVNWFKENAPQVLRGILSSFFKNDKLSKIKKFALKRMILNKLCCPHFITYDFHNLPNRFVKKYNHLPLIGYTIRNEEDFSKAVKVCDNLIFEGFDINKLI